MTHSIKIPYREADHGSFDEEWPPHKKVSGWWYVTGYLTDVNDPHSLYSYQYTLLRVRIYGVTLNVLQLAFTDLRSGQHIFNQRMTLRDGKLFPDTATAQFPPLARLHRREDDVTLRIDGDGFALRLLLDKGKGAVWHGENGVLVMGLPEDRKQRTAYYSYPNMPTRGKLRFRARTGETKTLRVTGKSWLDRQWGPYDIINPDTHWEWFSLRFFDDEEVMLFAFPQHPTYDGTYIDRDGHTHRLQGYEYSPQKQVEVDGFRFTQGWTLHLPGIKEEHYEIRPIIDGQMNLAYFELLAEIINPAGEKVGYCFVELLPGVRNPGKYIGFHNLLKRR